MSDPQNDTAEQQVADQEDESVDTQPADPNEYPIRIHDPEIECVVGLGYD